MRRSERDVRVAEAGAARLRVLVVRARRTRTELAIFPSISFRLNALFLLLENE